MCGVSWLIYAGFYIAAALNYSNTSMALIQTIANFSLLSLTCTSFLHIFLPLSITRYFRVFLKESQANTSKQRRKKGLNVHMNEVIAHNQGYFIFMKFLVKEFSVENILFITEIQYFKSKFQQLVEDNYNRLHTHDHEDTHQIVTNNMNLDPDHQQANVVSVHDIDLEHIESVLHDREKESNHDSDKHSDHASDRADDHIQEENANQNSTSEKSTWRRLSLKKTISNIKRSSQSRYEANQAKKHAASESNETSSMTSSSGASSDAALVDKYALPATKYLIKSPIMKEKSFVKTMQMLIDVFVRIDSMNVVNVGSATRKRFYEQRIVKEIMNDPDSFNESTVKYADLRVWDEMERETIQMVHGVFQRFKKTAQYRALAKAIKHQKVQVKHKYAHIHA